MADIQLLGPNQVLSNTTPAATAGRTNVQWQGDGEHVSASIATAVTSVGLSLPSIFTVTVSPITTTGTLTAVLATTGSNTFLAGPVSGGSAIPTFRLIQPDDLTLADSTHFGIVRPDNTTITIGSGVISATITTATQTLNTFFSGPLVGSPAAPTFRLIDWTDLPVATSTVRGIVLTDNTTIAVSGSGIISAIVSTATRAANLIFAGPASGGAAAPTFRAMVADDLGTTLSPTFAAVTINSIGTGLAQLDSTTTSIGTMASFLQSALANGNRTALFIGKALTNNNSSFIGHIPNATANQSLTTIGQFGAAELITIRGDGFVGIGSGTSSIFAPLYVVNNANTTATLVVDTYGGAGSPLATQQWRSARGSLATPAAVQTGDLMGGVRGIAFNASAFSTRKVAVNFYAAETWTTGANGCYIVFETTPIGSTTIAEVMRIDTTASVLIGVTSQILTGALFNVKLGTSANAASQPAGAWAAVIVNATNLSGYNGLLVETTWGAATSIVFECGLNNGTYSSLFKVDQSGNLYTLGTIGFTGAVAGRSSKNGLVI